MISVDQAEHIILSEKIHIGIETIALADALGRVTASTWLATGDFPPFDRVTMDGIAIHFSDYEAGQRHFYCTDLQRAGEEKKTLRDKDTCIEIMTGAVLCSGADTIIPYEDVTKEENSFFIKTNTARKGQNIHFRGEDKKKGACVLSSEKVISPAEIGIAASLGFSTLKVYTLPAVAIVSTGDELVPIEATPLPHQIRKSNVHTISAILHQHHISSQLFHFPDDRTTLEQELKKLLSRFDLILISGGVSKGKYDYIPKVLETLGVFSLFHGIAQRPGKPFFMGKKENSLVFAFPGNPVSVFLCVYRYFIPWLRKAVFMQPFHQEYAILTQDLPYKLTLTQFIPVRLTVSSSGHLLASPNTPKGSGDFIQLADADAFLELPIYKDKVTAGNTYKVFRFR